MSGYFDSLSYLGVESVGGVGAKGKNYIPVPYNESASYTCPASEGVEGVENRDILTPSTPEIMQGVRSKEHTKASVSAESGNNLHPLHLLHPQNSELVNAEPELWQERAAIIEHEAGIPRKWAEAFARVDCMEKPAAIKKDCWQRIKDTIGRMLDTPEHINGFERHGWAVGDIFGCHARAPQTRLDAMGLVFLLRAHEVISVVDSNTIALKNIHNGNQLCFTRRTNTQEGVMLWELR